MHPLNLLLLLRRVDRETLVQVAFPSFKTEVDRGISDSASVELRTQDGHMPR